MSQISEHHKALDRFGQGKCSVPMWAGGFDSGFCGRPAYGNRPEGEMFFNYAANEEMRLDGRYAGYIPALACPIHGGPKVRVFMDGNAFCAVHPDFVNLQESPAGFGDTAERATENLFKEPK